jgi:hypothetical protein
LFFTPYSFALFSFSRNHNDRCTLRESLLIILKSSNIKLNQEISNTGRLACVCMVKFC